MIIVNTLKSNLENAVLLANSERPSLGFIPYPRLARDEAAGRLRHQIENGTWVGYLVHGPMKANRHLHINQECIDKSARRYGSATRLFHGLLADAIAAASLSIRLTCAADLDSNRFWLSLGFDLANHLVRQVNKRGRPLNAWVMHLPGSLLFKGKVEYI
jgi:hypothetical protein